MKGLIYPMLYAESAQDKKTDVMLIFLCETE